MRMALKDRIAEIIAAGHKAARLAEYAGTSQAAVSLWLSGDTKSIKSEPAAGIQKNTGYSAVWIATGKLPKFASDAEHAGVPKTVRRTPVVGTARMGDNGFYEELAHPVGYGDGWIDGYSSNKNAYALRVKGDSMHPAIRHGYFVVVNPGGQCVPTEYVAISMLDGRKMVKELVKETSTEVVIESVNGNHRQTLDKSDIEQMSPIAAVVSPSNWRSE